MVDGKAGLLVLITLALSGCVTSKPVVDQTSVVAPPGASVEAAPSVPQEMSFMGGSEAPLPSEVVGDVGLGLAAAAERALALSDTPTSVVPLTSAPVQPVAVSAAPSATDQPSIPMEIAVSPPAQTAPSLPDPAASAVDDLQRAVASLASGMPDVGVAPQVPMAVPVSHPVTQAPPSAPGVLPPPPIQRTIVMVSGAGAVQMASTTPVPVSPPAVLKPVKSAVAETVAVAEAARVKAPKRF